MLKNTYSSHIDKMVQRVDTVRGTPWEGIGHPLPEKASLEDTLRLAGLDWGVVKRQAWIDTIPTGVVSEERIRNRVEERGPLVPKKVPGNYVLTRDDTMEPISPFVGARYKPIQNSDAFEVFREFCEVGDMTMETAGSLFNGQHIWGLARIEGDYTLIDGEVIRGYFLLMQSHVYGSALKAMFTPVRYPGGHTLVQAINRTTQMKRTYTMSHSRSWSEARMKEVREVMGTAQTVLADFVDEARALSEVFVDEEQSVLYFIQVFHPTLHNKIEHGAVKNIPTRIADLKTWDESNRNLKKVPGFLEDYEGADLPTCQGTAWGLMQATNYAFDHVIGNGQDTRLASSWMGANAKKKLKALGEVQKLAK